MSDPGLEQSAEKYARQLASDPNMPFDHSSNGERMDGSDVCGENLFKKSWTLGKKGIRKDKHIATADEATCAW